MVIPQHLEDLKRLNLETLEVLQSVVLRMNQEVYTHVNFKGNASVGQHVRHTIEFYQCLFEATDTVNYDLRKRDLALESSAAHALDAITSVKHQLRQLNACRNFKLHTDLPPIKGQVLEVDSSLSRELLYVLEHSIHHMALIRVLLKDEDPNFELDDSFGVAYSTLAYRNEEAADH